MRGQKIVMWAIKDIEEAGLKVVILKPGEYPIVKAIENRRRAIIIDFSNGSVEGNLSRKTAVSVAKKISWLFREIKIDSDKRQKGTIGGTLIV